jgi:hypothetical protein
MNGLAIRCHNFVTPKKTVSLLYKQWSVTVLKGWRVFSGRKRDRDCCYKPITLEAKLVSEVRSLNRSLILVLLTLFLQIPNGPVILREHHLPEKNLIAVHPLALGVLENLEDT